MKFGQELYDFKVVTLQISRMQRPTMCQNRA